MSKLEHFYKQVISILIPFIIVVLVEPSILGAIVISFLGTLITRVLLEVFEPLLEDILK